jgi:hypothetical protein
MKTILLFVMALPLLLTPLAHANPPTTATGTFTATFTILAVTTAGGNTIITVNETATLTGSFVRTRIAQGSEIIHPDGSFIASDTGTFTGTVNGVSGTLVIAGHSTGTGGTGAGSFVINQGTDDLADVHGLGPFQFTATGPTSTTGTYSVITRQRLINWPNLG